MIIKRIWRTDYSLYCYKETLGYFLLGFIPLYIRDVGIFRYNGEKNG